MGQGIAARHSGERRAAQFDMVILDNMQRFTQAVGNRMSQINMTDIWRRGKAIGRTSPVGSLLTRLEWSVQGVYSMFLIAHLNGSVTIGIEDTMCLFICYGATPWWRCEHLIGPIV